MAESEHTTTRNNSIWPESFTSAVSFSFDDARASQVTTGVPVFDSFTCRATFYVLPSAVTGHIEEWKGAVSNGHEIGNHTVHHPCCRNFGFSGEHNLERYSLASMLRECTEANRLIEASLGTTPSTFAYPCGQSYVGLGVDTRSYIPLIAERFVAARCFAEGAVNNPDICNLHQLASHDSDGMSAGTMKGIIGQAREIGGWVIFAGHEIGNPTVRQTTGVEVLREVLAMLRDTMPDVWLAPITEIAHHVAEIQHRTPRKE